MKIDRLRFILIVISIAMGLFFMNNILFPVDYSTYEEKVGEVIEKEHSKRQKKGQRPYYDIFIKVDEKVYKKEMDKDEYNKVAVGNSIKILVKSEKSSFRGKKVVLGTKEELKQLIIN